MSDLRQDLTHAVRALARRPGFSAVAIGTIALAIAANTAVFSIVYGVLLKPLPYKDPGQLVALDSRSHTGFLVSLSMPNYQDWRDKNRVFQTFAATTGWGFVLTGAGQAQVVSAQAVQGDFFGMLGLTPQVGRLPGADETPARPGAPAIAVLSHAFWQQRFGGDRSIVGRSLILDARPYAVVGVLPAGVGYPEPDVDVYVPLSAVPGLPWDDRGSSFGTEAIARLKPGVDLATAQQDLARVGREMRAELGPTVAVPEVKSLATYFVGDVRTQIWILMGAVGFVLLIAVANVGNLLLARGEERQKELAVRSALGAGRGAIVRLLLVEALLLAAVGGALGAAAAYAAVGAVVPLLPADLPAVLLPRIQVDGVVLAFAVGIALVTGVLFGLAPALKAAGVNLSASLRSGARSSTPGRGGLRPALVVSEVTLALIVLVGAGLMIRSLNRLSHVDKGFDAAGILTAAVPATDARAPNRDAWRAFYHDLREQVAALPGVRRAALALLLPLSQRSWELRIHPEGVPVTPETGQSVLYNIVSPEYFAAMNVPILRGRGFTGADREGAPLVALIDETMAANYWPGADPIGKRVTFETDSLDAPVYRTVVGVTRNVRHYRLTEPSRVQVYVPVDQTFRRWGMTLRLVLQTDGDPAQVAGPLRDLVARIDPDAPLSGVQPLGTYVDRALARSRAMTRVLVAFGIGALALAALGIFGVMSYEVTRRTREIGIRMALGAATLDVMRWIGGRALRVTALGLAIGVAGAVGVTRVLRGMLFEVSPLDPLCFVAGIAGLAIVALLAAYLPARRATRVDPVTVLADEG